MEHGLSRSNFDDNDWCRRNDLYCRSITGTAIGASSDVIALSIAIGLIKSVFFMVGTPLLAKFMYLKVHALPWSLAVWQEQPVVQLRDWQVQMYDWYLMAL